MRLLCSALALLMAPLAQAEPLAPLPSTSQGEGYAVLIVSRERLEVATTCEVALYLYDQMAARLHQGQSVSFNLPPGRVSLRLGLTGTGPVRTVSTSSPVSRWNCRPAKCAAIASPWAAMACDCMPRPH